MHGKSNYEMGSNMLEIITVEQVSVLELGLNKSNEALLYLLIADSEALYNDFLQHHWKNNGKPASCILSFRNARLEASTISEQDFANMYDNNKKEALEQLFLHPVSKMDITLLEDRLHNTDLTLSNLYKMHKEVPQMQLFSHIC